LRFWGLCRPHEATDIVAEDHVVALLKIHVLLLIGAIAVMRQLNKS
jgi:hypothetical protein